MIPVIKAVVTADTKQAEAGFDRVERGLHDVGSAADHAGRSADRLSRRLSNATSRSRSMQRGIQNAAFQVGDFAVQVGAGARASQALAMQLPQLLGGFGALGAVLGAVVAIGIPLAVVFKGMSDSGRDVTQVFGTLQPIMASIAQSMAQVQAVFVGAADAIINNLDRIIITAGVAASFFAAKWVAAFVAARVATFSLSAALVALRGALIRTGFGAIIVAAGELVYQFTRLMQAAGGFGEAMSLVGDIAVEVWYRIGDGGRGLYLILKGAAKGIAAAFLSAFASIAEKWDALVNGMATAWNAIAESQFGSTLGLGTLGGSSVGSRLRGAAEGMAGSAVSDIREGGGLIGGAATKPLASVQKIRDLLRSIKDERITLPDLLGTGGGDDGSGGGGKGQSASEKLDEELTAQEKRIADHFDRIRALTQGGLSDKLGAWGSYFGNLAQLTGTNNKKLLGIQKSFAAAQALIDAWQAHNAVLADPDLPWWARVASAANVLAAGIGAVNAIKSVSADGGAVSGAAGGGAAASAAPAAPQGVTYINLQGEVFGRSTVEGLVEQLQIGLDRGQRLVMA